MSSLMRKFHLWRTGKQDDVLDISPITDCLFASGWPAGQHVNQIAEHDISLIISMIREKQAVELTQPPFQNVQLKTTDFVLMPISTQKLRQGVDVALPVIERGGKVLTYCKSGIHRSVAMASCILIAKGYSVDEATRMIKQARAIAKPDSAHIHKQIVKFAQEWQATVKEA